MKSPKSNRSFLGLNPPDSARRAVWSADQTALDIDKHQSYIVHQLLMFADLDATAWLFRVYGKKAVQNTFIKQPSRIYQAASFNFNTQYILGLNPTELDPKQYVVDL